MLKYNYKNLRNDYMTPPELVELALKIKGVEYFVLDVCYSKKNIPALYHYIDGKKDGLTRHWEILNWCNPPFNQCDKWYILFNENVKIFWLKKGTRFINPENNKPMGIFKNALALIFFNTKEQQC